jgi:hypothetical protein
MQSKTHFLFEHVVIRFGCQRILMSDQGLNLLTIQLRQYLKSLRYIIRRALLITLKQMEGWNP